MLKECSPKCVSKKHADELSQAISNADNFEEQVITQLQTCYNVSSNKDSMGRTALQVAASFGRVKILSWLLSQDVQVHAKDEESGYSALHRAFFYGQLQSARVLLKKHLHLNNPQDYDGMCPLDHLTKDISIFKGLDSSLPCEVYVWGSNSNYLLGNNFFYSYYFLTVNYEACLLIKLIVFLCLFQGLKNSQVLSFQNCLMLSLKIVKAPNKWL